MKKILLMLLFLASTILYAQRVTVTGTVTDSQGNPLPRATVQVRGTNLGILTDAGGKFSIETGPGSVLVISFVGFNTSEINVGSQTTININLKESVLGLEEVVVVDYGTQKKLNLTAAVDQVTNETLENRSVPNLTQGLKGVLPNLNINLLDGKPIQAPSFNIRGTTSIGQGGSALVLIPATDLIINPNLGQNLGW